MVLSHVVWSIFVYVTLAHRCLKKAIYETIVKIIEINKNDPTNTQLGN